MAGAAGRQGGLADAFGTDRAEAALTRQVDPAEHGLIFANTSLARADCALTQIFD